jgi:hypothetical protein
MNLDLSILDNEIVATGLSLFLGLYAITASRVKLPPYLKNLFNNSIFRVMFLAFLLTQNFNKVPHVAFIMSLVFVMTLQALGEEEIKENFAYLEAYSNSMKR